MRGFLCGLAVPIMRSFLLVDRLSVRDFEEEAVAEEAVKDITPYRRGMLGEGGSSAVRLGSTSSSASLTFLCMRASDSSSSDSRDLETSSSCSVSEPGCSGSGRLRLRGVTVDAFFSTFSFLGFFALRAFCLPSSSTWQTRTGTSARERTSIQTCLT